MLAMIANTRPGSLEEVVMNASLRPNDDWIPGTVRFGHPFELRASLRDGTQVLLALTKGECAELYGLFCADRSIGALADVMSLHESDPDPEMRLAANE